MKLINEIWSVALRDLRNGKNNFFEFLMIGVFSLIIILIGEGTKILFSENIANYNSFFATGIIGFYAGIFGLSLILDLIIDKKGFFKVLLTVPISRTGLLLGKLLGLFLKSMKTSLFIILFLSIYAKGINFISIVGIFLACAVIFFIFAGLAFIIASFIEKQEIGQQIMQILIFLGLVQSGIFYSIKNLPESISWSVFLNPFYYAVELARYAYTGITYLNPILMIIFMIILSISTPIVGIILFEKKLRN